MIEAISGEKLILRCNHASRDFLKHISDYRGQDLFTDVRLHVAEFGLRAHKIILSACSPYFEKLFTGDRVENKETNVNLEVCCSVDSLKELVDYMYNGIMEVTPDNLEDVLRFSDFLLLENTRSAILKFLQQNLTNENCLRYLHLGRLYCSEELVSSALRYLKCHFHSIYEENPNFSDISLDDMMDLIRQNASSLFIKSGCEAVPFLIKAILKWNEAHELSLDDLWSSILKHLNYNEGSLVHLPSELRSRVNYSPSGQDVQTDATERLNQLLIAVAYDEKEIEYLDLDNIKDGWNVLSDIPGMRYGLCGASLTAHKGKIYITGGVGTGGIMSPLKRFLIYDLQSNSWSNGPEMLSPRRCHGSCIWDSKLYVFGGENEGNGCSEVYSLKSEKWTLGPNIPSEEKIQSFSYLIPQWTSSILCLSNYGDGLHGDDWILHDGHWARFQSERIPRDHPGFGWDPEGNPLVIGGKQESLGYLGMTERLNSDETYGSRWGAFGKLVKPRASPGVASSSKTGLIYVVGGKGSEGTMETNCGENNSWEILGNTKLRHPDQEYAAAILDR